ncbi:MAG: amidohydrolase family protein [SAR202 cluster bacterium]|nr:amidohydrolase family protein [SAR202 cluster bacterium]MDP7414361.1 amidohydrolase family protein [SAR202 cluster bacterium]MDP7533045.1 amidohydrolase family protein [SAR202 cluster bacterium]
METRNPTIDSQVHSYERNRPERPWIGTLRGPEEVTGDDMVAAMDAVGVDGALLVSPYSMYRYDASYALEVHQKHPGRFGLIRPFDPQSEAIADEVAEWAATPGVVGARIMLTYGSFEGDDPGLNQILAAGAQAGIPVNVMGSGKLPIVRELARRNPETQIVIDHVGLVQPHEPPAPPDTFADLADVVSLAELDNVAIKISGACTLSHEPFPYTDIWAPLRKIFDAFGFDRCMWGTDWTRAIDLLTYEQGVEAFRVTDQLSDSERSTLMGGALTKIYKWSPDTSG